jgi:peptide/nickel transport system permease protein
VTLAITMLTAALTVLGSLIADLSYAVLDPRVRLD